MTTRDDSDSGAGPELPALQAALNARLTQLQETRPDPECYPTMHAAHEVRINEMEKTLELFKDTEPDPSLVVVRLRETASDPPKIEDTDEVGEVGFVMDDVEHGLVCHCDNYKYSEEDDNKLWFTLLGIERAARAMREGVEG